MKCIICNDEATYIFRGMSYCKEHYLEAQDKEKPLYNQVGRYY